MVNPIKILDPCHWSKLVLHLKASDEPPTIIYTHVFAKFGTLWWPSQAPCSPQGWKGAPWLAFWFLRTSARGWFTPAWPWWTNGLRFNLQWGVTMAKRCHLIKWSLLMQLMVSYPLNIHWLCCLNSNQENAHKHTHGWMGGWMDPYNNCWEMLKPSRLYYIYDILSWNKSKPCHPWTLFSSNDSCSR